MVLHLGYFENFQGSNTILLCGDEGELPWLADHLRTLEAANTKSVNLHLLPFVRAHGSVELAARPMDRELGVRRAGPAPCFAWHHSEEGWLESAEKVEAVARGNGGHCYLGEAPPGDAVVMVSKDEYDEAWWKEHG